MKIYLAGAESFPKLLDEVKSGNRLISYFYVADRVNRKGLGVVAGSVLKRVKLRNRLREDGNG